MTGATTGYGEEGSVDSWEGGTGGEGGILYRERGYTIVNHILITRIVLYR